MRSRLAILGLLWLSALAVEAQKPKLKAYASQKDASNAATSIARTVRPGGGVAASPDFLCPPPLAKATVAPA